jgi:hypothetical protein
MRENATLFSVLFAALLFIFLFGGCEKKDSGKALGPTHKEEKNMIATAPQVKEKPAIPPIDASIPARVETATFAMG